MLQPLSYRLYLLPSIYNVHNTENFAHDVLLEVFCIGEAYVPLLLSNLQCSLRFIYQECSWLTLTFLNARGPGKIEYRKHIFCLVVNEFVLEFADR